MATRIHATRCAHPLLAAVIASACTPPDVVIDAARNVAARATDKPDPVRVCEAEGHEIDEVWNDDAAARVREGLLGTGTPYAETSASSVVKLLDAQAMAWRVARAESCMRRTVEPMWDAATVERVQWCLDERRTEIDALVSELIASDATAARGAVTTASGLSPVSTCVDAAVLAGLPAAPAEAGREAAVESRRGLIRARLVAELGASDRARQMLDEVSPPLTAAEQLTAGRIHVAVGEFHKAEPALRSAHAQAVEAGAWQVAAGAATGLVTLLGVALDRSAEALRWATDAQEALTRAGDPGGLGEATLLRSRAIIERNVGRARDGIASLQRALALREAALGEHLLVAELLVDLPVKPMPGEPRLDARGSVERAKAIRTQLLGADHPDVARDLVRLAAIHEMEGSLPAAIAALERAQAVYEAALGPDHAEVALTLVELARLLARAGRGVEAEPAYVRGLAIIEKMFGPDHPRVIAPRAGLCRIALAQSNAEKALEYGERAVEVCSRQKPEDRECVDARLALADALWEVPVERGRDRVRAEAVVAEALGGIEVSKWQSTHRAGK